MKKSNEKAELSPEGQLEPLTPVGHRLRAGILAWAVYGYRSIVLDTISTLGDKYSGE